MRRTNMSVQLVWLHRDAFFEFIERSGPLPGAPQLIQLYVDSLAVRQQIPIAPALRPDDEDFAGPVERWYGHIGERYFLFDVHDEGIPKDDSRRYAEISTTFPDPPAFDWTTLLALEALPASIEARNITLVASRNFDSKDVVYRLDWRGFDCPLYYGRDAADAHSFADYLARRDRGGKYWVGRREPDVHWLVYRLLSDGRRLAEGSPNRTSAVTVACRNSLCTGDRYRVVCSEPSIDGRVYDIFDGKVVRECRPNDAVWPQN